MSTLVDWLHRTAVLVLLVMVYFIVPTSADTRASVLGRVVVVVLLLTVTAWIVVRQLRLAVLDSDRRIDGLVLAVIVMTLSFAMVYYVLELRHHGEVDGLETRVDALYFTVSTILTVGYGDIHAEGQAARTLVLVQMVFDVVFVATTAAVVSSRVRDVATTRAAARRRANHE
ncbi:MAG: two pore domain potassium channel family protein [Aeromicrobium sp.]|jgi:voltage-gated potassium channel|nr:two pore domain potassium channel family protein [Aeromicrobium sp.]